MYRYVHNKINLKRKKKMKTIIGKIKGRFEKTELNNGTIVQKFSLKPENESAIYVIAYGNSNLLDKYQIDDEVIVDINEKPNGKYINNYLVNISSLVEAKKKENKEANILKIKEQIINQNSFENNLEIIREKIVKATEDQWRKAGGKTMPLINHINSFLLPHFKKSNMNKWNEYTERLINKILTEINEKMEINS